MFFSLSGGKYVEVEAATAMTGFGGRVGRVGRLVLATSSTSISFSTDEARLGGKKEMNSPLDGGGGAGDGK